VPKVLYDKRGEIAYITLNRPEKRNAIDTETDDLLFDAWTRFREDDQPRLAILESAEDTILEVVGRPLHAVAEVRQLLGSAQQGTGA
jgi:enoyl-CoA hydratase/carnithine racemase